MVESQSTAASRMASGHFDLDDNDDEAWRSWTSEPVRSLGLVVPKDWPIFHASKIHPDFVDWFRTNYDKARKSLPEHQSQYQEKHRHERWSEVIVMPRQ